jgi:hypothetical protein
MGLWQVPLGPADYAVPVTTDPATRAMKCDNPALLPNADARRVGTNDLDWT